MENVAKVKINGESCMALLDNGAQVNTITLRYVKEHSLPVGPITDLMGSKVTCIGLGNAYNKPLGYVVIRVQVDGVRGYDKDQIALIIPDFSNFVMRVPVILGTLTIGWVVNVMKEAEMDTLAMPWVNPRAAHLLAIRRMTPVEVGNDCEEGYNTNQDRFMMHTQKIETLEPFSSHVIPMKMTEAYLGECLNIMVQALYVQDGTLPPGLTMQNMYTELRKGSKKAVVVIQNHTAYPQTLQKKTTVAQAIPVQLLPKTPEPGSLTVPDKVCPDPQTPKLTIRQRHGKLFDELDLRGLDSWAPELADKAHQLLAKYHDIFSLDPVELGCTHSNEHTIKVTDDTPFKEHFRRIPPLMVEEVGNHLKEMLESGAIRPSQSAWCNAVMLVRKKDSSLHFCIDFWCLNARMKKESYLLPQIQEVLESLVGAGHFSCLTEVQILADKNGWGIKAVYHLYCG